MPHFTCTLCKKQVYSLYYTNGEAVWIACPSCGSHYPATDIKFDFRQFNQYGELPIYENKVNGLCITK